MSRTLLSEEANKGKVMNERCRWLDSASVEIDQWDMTQSGKLITFGLIHKATLFCIRSQWCLLKIIQTNESHQSSCDACIIHLDDVYSYQLWVTQMLCDVCIIYCDYLLTLPSTDTSQHNGGAFHLYHRKLPELLDDSNMQHIKLSFNIH